MQYLTYNRQGVLSSMPPPIALARPVAAAPQDRRREPLPTLCPRCGETIDLEMERDEGICANCLANDAGFGL